ncbi:gluconate 5-dehydrogenase [Ruegeria sp. ANG-R]|uniref:SDR family NAD(P)-dependent oxidoreductase n=1 Tax=Ruegeria sp. ANG-R TaxID=1577903 RepID=UPI000580A18E|nr:SDR family oxidoreductase [Ruegeria sp. ANG-R]KIC42160.1 gluconate 5-dehydrogenase [Ruegeria sp. ANG-R]
MAEFPPSELFNVAGRVACVTGASSGLGRRAAEVLARAGALVVAVARRADMLDELCSGTDGELRAVQGDVADRGAIDDLVQQICAGFGPPDIVIHAAGLNTREDADAVSAEGWDATIAVNLTAPFFLSQKLVPGMQRKGWGRIVNFASLQSFRAFPGGIAYGASKGGVAQLTRAMAQAWSKTGVNINALAPGFFETELTAAVFADEQRAARNATQTCIGRNGEPEDLDGPLLFLCSEASRYVTGQVLMLDGGYTAK